MKKATIRLSQNVFARLEAARSLTGSLEFSGLGFVKVQTVHHETLYAVYDVVLLNVGSPGFTEINLRISSPFWTDPMQAT